MKFRKTPIPDHEYMIGCSTAEWVLMKAALGELARLLQGHTSTPDGQKIFALAMVMHKEMEAFSSVNRHVPLQDKAISSSGPGGKVRIPAVAERPGSGAAVRSTNGKDKDVNRRNRRTAPEARDKKSPGHMS